MEILCKIHKLKYFEFFKDLKKCFGYKWEVLPLFESGHILLNAGTSKIWIDYVSKETMETIEKENTEFYYAKIKTEKPNLFFKLKWG